MAKIKIIEMIDKAALGGGQTAVLFLARSLDPELFEVAVSSGGPGPLVEAAGRHGLRPFAARPREPFQPSGRRRPSPGSWPSIRTPYPRRLCRALRASGRPAGSDSIIVHTLHGIHYLHYRNPALQLFSIWQERFLSRTTDALVLVCQSDMSRAKRYRLAPRDRLVAIPNGLDIRQPDGPPPAVDFSRRPGLGREDRSSGRRRLAAKRGSSPLRAAPRILPPPSPRPGLPWWGRDRWRNSGIGPRRSASMAGSSSLERARMSVPSCRSSTSSSCRRSGRGCLAPGRGGGARQADRRHGGIDGVPEIIDNGKTGILVPPGDAEALANAVISVLSDEPKAAGMAAAAKALNFAAISPPPHRRTTPEPLPPPLSSEDRLEIPMTNDELKRVVGRQRTQRPLEESASPRRFWRVLCLGSGEYVFSARSPLRMRKIKQRETWRWRGRSGTRVTQPPRRALRQRR